MNKQYKQEMLDSFSDNTAAATIEIMLDNIGRDLSNIINDNEYTDREIVVDIISYLKDKGLYVESQS